MPTSLAAVSDGIVIGFSDPLDAASAVVPGNYQIEAWNYRWTERYGSPDFKFDGSEGREQWAVAQAVLSDDRRSVFLSIPGIQPAMQVQVDIKVKAEDGGGIDTFIHATFHALASEAGRAILNKPAK